ncbi:MAG: TonB-dependent receptor [Phenylobacterium sp.]|nr:TonB-dependent receptor [Phenylobacterium sp.]
MQLELEAPPRGDGRRRTLACALLAGTMMSPPALALAQTAGSSSAPTIAEVIVTAQKRSENIQDVPASIQALGAATLERLNVNQFQDYVKYTPSVTFQSLAPSQTSIYMRGVSSGDNANHSGPLPSVGSYLDEQPITTIGGVLDIHAYDLARIEVLPGPQGTLYGASSEAGTLRIITNKPSTAGFSAGYDLQGVWIDHGSAGYVAEGFVNQPISDKMAVRLVAWDEHDPGFIDNVAATRTFPTSGATINNANVAKKNFNAVDTYGGRAALKVDLDEDWTITPSIIAQDQKYKGVFGYEPSVGRLQVERFQPDRYHDRWMQAALTVNGKIGNYDLVYSGGYFKRRVDQLSDYTDYSIFYDAAYGSGANWQDANGLPLSDPRQSIDAHDRFSKESHELRIVSPAGDRLRFIAGGFYERQTHWIIQNYKIAGFSPTLSPPGYPGTIWLTDQQRVDRDEALFGEVSFDVTKQLTLTGGIRGYKYHNSLEGFYGFGQGYNELTGFSSGQGANSVNCLFTTAYHNLPCVNLNKLVTGSGKTYRANATYKFDRDHLVYATFSTGYRPGGVNRNGQLGPYGADKLKNYEVGMKTAWLDHRLIVNASAYYEKWNRFQFSFLGLNSLTVVQNAPEATIKGVEASIDWLATAQLTLSGGLAYNDARLARNFCGADPVTGDIIPTCATADAIAPAKARLPYTPPFKGNLTARYTFGFMDWDAHLQGSVVYQSRTQVGLRTSDVGFLGSMPGYATADFSVGAEKDRLSVELYIKNAFDSHGQINRYTPCTVSVCAADVPGIPKAVYVVPVQPMTVGMRFGQKF